MRERYLYLADTPQGILMSGQVPEYQFWLLAEISPVHSEKVINALRDYLVMGYNRMEACGRHGVSPGYFSGALGNDSNLLIVFYVQIMPDDLVMQLHRF